MTVRPWAVFSVAPFDGEGVDGGRPQYETREVGDVIPEIFTRLGVAVIVADAHEDRWTFHLIYHDHHFLCRVVCLPANVVLRLYSLRGGRFSLKKPAIYAELAERFAAELNQSSRFRDVLWYPDRGGGPSIVPDGSGAALPLAPAARPVADLNRSIQAILLVIGGGGLIASILDAVSGDLSIALSTLIGSAIALGLASPLIKAMWLQRSSRNATGTTKKDAGCR